MLVAVRTILIAITTGVLLAPQPGFAQSKAPLAPLALRIEPVAPSPRSYAPILVEVTLDPRGDQLMEGTLHLTFLESRTTKLLKVHIPDIVVAGTEYTTTLLLPPMPTSNSTLVDVDAKFVTGTDAIILSDKDSTKSDLSLRVTPSTRRSIVIGMVVEGAEDPKTAAHTFLNQALSLEQYVEQPKAWSKNLRGILELKPIRLGSMACSSVLIKPDALLTDPLGFCAFDVVVIADGGLSKLDQGRMDAMREWVRAGGSLCVVPDGVIERRHTNFLIDLFAEHPDPPAMTLDRSSSFVAGWEGMHVQTRLGLGRVVLVDPNKPLRDKPAEKNSGGKKSEMSAATAAYWKKVAGFLWRVRKSQLDKDEWAAADPQKPPANGDENPYGRAYALSDYQRASESMTVRPIGQNEVTRQLMPSNVRMVPLWLVTTMLLAYVFIVGPGDYLLLGMLKMRRYTWIVFPIVTALFTMGMVGVSNYYMATTQNGGRIEINDIVGAGEIVRRTEISLDFFGAQRDVHVDHASQLITPLDMRASIHDWQFQNSMTQYGMAPASQSVRQPAAFSGDSSGLYYEGRVPGRYSTHRTVRQWEPQLNRTFEITSETAPGCGFDWEKPGKIWDPVGRQDLARAIQNHDPAIGAVVLNKGERKLLRPLAYPTSVVRDYREEWAFGLEHQSNPDYLTLPNQFSNRSLNFFRYVTTISPNGANNYEDLAMLDKTDPREWLLIVSWLEGDTQKVYRRLYHQPPADVENNK